MEQILGIDKRALLCRWAGEDVDHGCVLGKLGAQLFFRIDLDNFDAAHADAKVIRIARMLRDDDLALALHIGQ